MPSRVIREGLLDSQRYWSVTVEARQLFVHLMLLADDFGLVSLAPVFIRRRCFDDAPTPAKIDKLVEQLVDADLLRVYEAEGKRLAFIPRFGQRLRQMRAKQPPPATALYADDEHARLLFNAHAHLFEKMTAGRRRTADRSRTEVESKRNEKEVKTAPSAARPEDKTYLDWAVELEMVRQPDESQGAFQARVGNAVQVLKAAT